MLKQRIFAVMTAILLLPAASGCGLTQTTHKKGATLEIDLSTSYACEPFEYRGGQVTPLTVVDSGMIVEWYTPKGIGGVYLYDPETDSFKAFAFERKDAPAYVGQFPDGRYVFLYNDQLKKNSKGEQYDGKHRSAEIYDKDLKLTESFALPDEMPVGILQDTTIAMDQNGNWLFFSNNDVEQTWRSETDDTTDYSWFTGYYVLNPDFTVKGEITYDDNVPTQLVCGRSGAIYGFGGNAGAASQLCRFDCETMTAETLDTALPVGLQTLMNGSTCELNFCTEDGICGWEADGTAPILVDFFNSDLTDTVWSCWALHDGTFIAYYTDDNSNKSTYYRMRPRTEEEIANIKTISLAGVQLDKRLLKEVTAYNQSQSEYRFVIKDYGREWVQSCNDLEIQAEYSQAAKEWRSPYIDYTPAIENFKNDLLQGIVPDVICMDSVPYPLLSGKGILTDLAPLLAADPRYDESLYLHNIMKGLQRGDKLERIGFSFTISTFAAKTEFVGEKQWHTADEYIAMLKDIPDEMQYFPDNSRDEMTEAFLIDAQGTFIEKESMTCRFNSPAFVSLLELVNTLQPSDRLYSSTKDFLDAMEYGYNYSENHTLLCPMRIFEPLNYHAIHYADFQKADITLVGYPESAGGNGGMYRMDYTIALSAQSDREKPVMDFIMTELSKKRQSKVCLNTWTSCSLPVMREQLEYALMAASRGYHAGGNLNEQEMTVLREYVEGVRMYQDIDQSVSNIIREEAWKYFSGDCTAQEAGDTIQSRVSIYLAEMK